MKKAPTCITANRGFFMRDKNEKSFMIFAGLYLAVEKWIYHPSATLVLPCGSKFTSKTLYFICATFLIGNGNNFSHDISLISQMCNLYQAPLGFNVRYVNRNQRGLSIYSSKFFSGSLPFHAKQRAIFRN